MIASIEWLTRDTCSHLAFTLAHSLWQGVLLALLLAAVLRGTASGKSNLRYGASVTALALLLAAGAVTWGILAYTPAPTPRSGAAMIEIPIAGSTPVATEASRTVEHRTPNPNPSAAGNGLDWQPLVSVFWLAGVGAMLIRTGVMVLGAGRLRRRCRPLADPALTAEVERLRNVMGIVRRVRLGVVQGLQVPAVAGLLWPTILLPASMLSGVPLDHLRAILAHELAHIRRYDDLVNLFQLLVEAALFFNPAAWWISRHIRIEREACCDAAAATAIGDPATYARVLAGWAERAWRSRSGAGAALAFDGDDDHMPLLDRVRRLISADHRPTLRVSWYTLIGLVLVGGVLLTGLRLGGTLAADVAVRVFSPAERLEELAKVQDTYGPLPAGPYTEADAITVSGTIRAHDGRPLPQLVYLNLVSRRPTHTSSISIEVEGSHFSAKVAFGTLYLSASAPGYAPAFVGPFASELGGTLSEIELLLGPGFSARIRVLNDNDEPVPQAMVTGRYLFEAAAEKIEVQADDMGIATIDHCLGVPMALDVSAAGYELARTTLTLTPEKVETWRLQPAQVTTGVVVARNTGQPVAGATLRMLGDGGTGGWWHDPRDSKVAAVTDEQGRFVLDTLREDTAYHFYIEHPEYRRQLLTNVSAGMHIKESLGPPLFVRGRVVGPLERLDTVDGAPSIAYSNPYSIQNHTVSGLIRTPVVMQDGVARFAIGNIWPGTVQIDAGGTSQSIEVGDTSIDNVVIDLTPGPSPDATKQSTRTLVLRLELPADGPPPGGSMRVYTISQSELDDDLWTGITEPHDIAVNSREVTLEVPAPGRVNYDAGGLVGYWCASRSDIKVAPGERPLVIDVPLVAAGAIFGEVRDVDGSPARDARLSVVTAAPAPAMGHDSLDGNSMRIDASNARFMITPLPIGGQYAVVAQRGHASYAVSPVVALDDTAPTRRMDVQFVEGVTLNGQVLRPDGTPAGGIALRLAYQTPYSHGYGPPECWTTPDGRFQIEHVNPDAPGKYSIMIHEASGCRPLAQELGDLATLPEVIHVQLEPGYTLDGVVVDEESGLPLAGVEVYAIPTDPAIAEPFGFVGAERRTNDQGEFHFSKLAKGAYSIGTRAGRSHPVHAIGGQDEPVTIRVSVATGG